MLEIEDKLKNDEYKEKLLASLQQETQEIKKMVNSGLAPNDYKRYSKYVLALDASVSVLNKHEST